MGIAITYSGDSQQSSQWWSPSPLSAAGTSDTFWRKPFLWELPRLSNLLMFGFRLHLWHNACPLEHCKKTCILGLSLYFLIELCFEDVATCQTRIGGSISVRQTGHSSSLRWKDGKSFPRSCLTCRRQTPPPPASATSASWAAKATSQGCICTKSFAWDPPQFYKTWFCMRMLHHFSACNRWNFILFAWGASPIIIGGHHILYDPWTVW